MWVGQLYYYDDAMVPMLFGNKDPESRPRAGASQLLSSSYRHPGSKEEGGGGG